MFRIAETGMLFTNTDTRIYGLRRPTLGPQVWEENAVVARFVCRISLLGPLAQASREVQARVLEEVKTVARRLDVSAEAGVQSGYGRRVLCEEPGRWSLALISLRPGQQTELHDHSSWGCAVTVQGIERDRRFVHDSSGNLVLDGQHDYPRGAGYLFDPVDVHQPLGADPRHVTVALHFLVQDPDHTHESQHKEVVSS